MLPDALVRYDFTTQIKVFIGFAGQLDACNGFQFCLRSSSAASFLLEHEVGKGILGKIVIGIS
jgi:hypothetical protein